MAEANNMTMADYIRTASMSADYSVLHTIATRTYDVRFGRDITRLYEALTKNNSVSCVTLHHIYHNHRDSLSGNAIVNLVYNKSTNENLIFTLIDNEYDVLDIHALVYLVSYPETSRTLIAKIYSKVRDDYVNNRDIIIAIASNTMTPRSLLLDIATHVHSSEDYILTGLLASNPSIDDEIVGLLRWTDAVSGEIVMIALSANRTISDKLFIKMCSKHYIIKRLMEIPTIHDQLKVYLEDCADF